MAKLEDLLKSKGYSDSDLTGMAAILSDKRLRNTLEASFTEVETERDTYKQRDEEWQQNLDNQYTPAITRAEQDAHKARMEAAEAREQLKIAKEYGYLPEDAQARADAAAKAVRDAANAQTQTGFNPDDPKFREFANRFSMGEGDAMALYNYVAEEYRLLNGGSSLNEYVGRDGKRGMLALRAEALQAKKPIDQYANEKFNWDGRRAEQAAARQKAHDDEIARKAVEDYAVKHGNNPMTAIPNPSRMPMMPAKVDNGKIIHPWERPLAKTERLQRAYQTETKARVN